MAFRQGEKLSRVYQTMQAFIQQQYAANAHITVPEVYKRQNFSYIIHRDLFDFLVEERENILHILNAELAEASELRLQGFVRVFLASTMAWIAQYNQFLVLSSHQQVTLAGVYREYLADMRDLVARQSSRAEIMRHFQVIAARHVAALQNFLVGLAEDNNAQGVSLLDTPAVCAEYPVHLQLSILGIDSATLIEPVLDVGCGRKALLVKALREEGLEVYGIDRVVEPQGYLFQIDWLDFAFQERSWGTLLSHMAFSNHFIFHHLYRHGKPTLYAQKYMEMLRSLKVGGTLSYAPGLPFLEHLLPSPGYDVQKKKVPVPISRLAPYSARSDAAIEQAISYSTTVRRSG